MAGARRARQAESQKMIGALAVPIDWKPIETAPRGRPVMCYVPGGMWTSGNPYLVAEWSDNYEDKDTFVTVDDPCPVKPTHWSEVNAPNGATDWIADKA
jgi:hypothetical protein